MNLAILRALPIVLLLAGCATQEEMASESADEAATEVATPDGKRGDRTAFQLIRAARAAARAGRDDDAIAFIKVCQWHNQESYEDIDRDRAVILEYLRNLEMI